MDLHRRAYAYLVANSGVLASGWGAVIEALMATFGIGSHRATLILYELIHRGYLDYEQGVLSARENPELLTAAEVDEVIGVVFVEADDVADSFPERAFRVIPVRRARNGCRRPGERRPPPAPRR